MLCVPNGAPGTAGAGLRGWHGRRWQKKAARRDGILAKGDPSARSSAGCQAGGHGRSPDPGTRGNAWRAEPKIYARKITKGLGREKKGKKTDREEDKWTLS